MKNSKKSEQRIQNQFGAFCTRVLKNETRYIQRELGNKAIREKSYDELSEKDLCELAAYDNYFDGEHSFDVQGKEIVVKGDMLAAALEKLPADKRDIILLAYFLDMTDQEIADKLDMVRYTVQRRRAKSLKELKKEMEVDSSGEQTG